MTTVDLLDAFLAVVPSGRRSARGWMNFNCPMCGDTRGRCGVMVTPTGGFRARCFNSGCTLSDSPTGWEPGSGFGGRPRKLYEALGGDVRDLPIDAILRKADTFDLRGGRVSAEAPRLRFDRMDLPVGCAPLWEAEPTTDGEERGLMSCVSYLEERLGAEMAEAISPMWSPRHPFHVITAFRHHGEVVGWQGRKSTPGKDRFIGQSPADYVYRQDTLERTDARAAIVVEGVTDADAILGVGIRNSTPTKKQVALLEGCGQRIIVLPDWQADATRLIDEAERRGWDVSVPEWDPGIKDATEAARRYGRLYAVASVVSGAGRNYLKARAAARLRELN